MPDAATIKDFEFWQTNDPKVSGLRVIDSKGRHFDAATDSSGVAALIGLALHHAAHPDFARVSIASHGVKSCAADGTRLELAAGRGPKECAVKLTVGCVEVIVFLPLEEVLRACAELVKEIAPDSPGSAPH